VCQPELPKFKGLPGVDLRNCSNSRMALFGIAFIIWTKMKYDVILLGKDSIFAEAR